MPVGDVLLIPWRGGDPFRERNLRYVLEWYDALHLEVYFGDSGHESFNRGASRNAASEAAGPWKRALIADADCLAELNVVNEAFDLASETGKMMLPHDDWWGLSEKGTQKFMLDPSKYRNDPFLFHRLVPMRWGQSKAPSGAIVLTHAAFDAIGGYDPDFQGWGYEDTAFLRDAEATVGTDRLRGRLIHLYHPKESVSLEAEAHNQELVRKHMEQIK